jgi:hypothetical protein
MDKQQMLQLQGLNKRFYGKHKQGIVPNTLDQVKISSLYFLTNNGPKKFKFNSLMRIFPNFYEKIHLQGNLHIEFNQRT